MREACAFLVLIGLAGCAGGDDATGSRAADPGSVPAGRGAPPASAPPPAFTDVTASSGVVFTHDAGAVGNYWLPEGIGSGGALFDLDGDGDLDLYLVQGGPLPVRPSASGLDPTNRLYRNDGDLHFTDITADSGADVGGYGLGSAAEDYDGDGDVDLFITRLGPNVLLRNDGGRFTDVTSDAGLDHPGFGTSAAFLDYDGDGHLDLYVSNYVEWAPHNESACFDPRGVRDYCGPLDYEAPSADCLYRGLGDGRFEDVSERAGIAGARGNGLGVLCSDFDGDGHVDIFVANDQTPGFLWMNQGDGTFLEDGAIRGCGFNGDGISIAGMGVAAEDLDGDGDFDLVVTNIHDQAHLALRNDDGFFFDVSHSWGFGGWGVPYTGFGIALFDQDHDGRLDGLVANGAVNRLAEPMRADHPFAEPDQFLRRAADGSFTDVSEEAAPAVRDRPEMSRGILVGDLDGDGDLDVVITANRGPTRVLRNDGAAGAWTLLDLGRALNARVEITAGERTLIREVRPHSTYLGTHDARVHAGLADATSIDRLVVQWPDGRRDVWADLPVNRVLRVRPGLSPVAVTP